MFKRSDYHFDLPDELIAQYPSERRDQSRLLVLNRQNKSLTDKQFPSIIDHLNSGDCLVVNNTKVIPARLNTTKADTGGKVEIFLLKPLAEGRWEALAKPAKKVKIGTELTIGDCRIIVEDINAEGGTRTVRVEYNGNLDDFLQEQGNQPLPPYIKREAEESDKDRYQTVYAENKGAVAAPTAGLHFTPELMEEIREKGITIAPVTLHVGLGTFRPVASEDILDHTMHAEYYTVPDETSRTIAETRARGSRVVCVGTTSVRTLESAANAAGEITELSGWTSKFIYPSYTFRIVDALITNFHTPESTLLMLVSALAGYDFIKDAYVHAVSERYRFFSYGDSMLIE